MILRISLNHGSNSASVGGAFMVAQFQSAMASIYNGWFLFGCLLFSFVIFPSLAMKLSDLRKFGFLQVFCWIAILTSIYVLLEGAAMAVTWADPFAGKEGQMAGAIHNPKGWIIVAAILVWPYLLMILGSLIGYLAIRDLRRVRRAA
ncbi:hypothetical protein [Rhizobium leguminosarum]|uniref:hypothetical protein n=1 Tax=Rhizobium leguminosarum TaxID=384 RepID=UPI001FE1214E|nr:hypothetical protein [Rhizobium leguminosarum]